MNRINDSVMIYEKLKKMISIKSKSKRIGKQKQIANMSGNIIVSSISSSIPSYISSTNKNISFGETNMMNPITNASGNTNNTLKSSSSFIQSTITSSSYSSYSNEMKSNLINRRFNNNQIDLDDINEEEEEYLMNENINMSGNVNMNNNLNDEEDAVFDPSLAIVSSTKPSTNGSALSAGI